jgi:peptidoglycan/xylan/chitin deacetylase (PgdA/CDA1 family)
MNYIGSDSKIMGKANLSDSEQKETLSMANKKMKRIFGNTSEIFVPPYGYFNNNTLEVMNDLGIGILSSIMYSENKFDKGRSIFNKSAELAQDLDDVFWRLNNNISLYTAGICKLFVVLCPSV